MMAYELEALVGHLYLVGGRTISAPPPGALVEVAPRKAARAREGETFFCLVLPVGGRPAPPIFYEEMAALAAERYFDGTSSVTAALRDVISHLNENLYAHNTSSATRYEASMVCAALRGTELYLAKAGAGAAVIRSRGELLPFPTAFDNTEALGGTPMGALSSIEPRMTRCIVNAGTRLVIGDPLLAGVPMDELEDALSRSDLSETLVKLRERLTTERFGRITAALLAAEFAAPDLPTHLPVRAAESTASLSGRAARFVAGVGDPGPTPPNALTGETIPARRDAAQETRFVAGALAGTAAAAVGGVNKVLDKVIPLPDENAPPKKGSGVGLAVLIPLAVVVLVIALWLTGTGESEFDLCVRQAQSAAETARGIASSDAIGTLAGWRAVIQVVEQCKRLRADDPQMLNLMMEARAIVDTLMRVERRDVTLIETFPNAQISRLLLQGSDLYALDSRNQQVYRVTLTTDGMAIIPGTRQPLPAMRRGGVISQYTVSDIIDIGWTETSIGFSQGNVIVALDRSGLLIDCAPRFLGDCSAQRVLGTETWIAPKAITFWQGRMYVLDPGANQLWRYDPLGGSFPNAPTEYFTGEGRPDIRAAVDVAIDDGGYVYILFANGSIRRFRGGRDEPFGYANFPANAPPASALAFFLNTNPVRQGIFIVDQQSRTLYETTLAGTFIASFRPQDEDLFAQLSDVAVDTAQEIIYAASGNGVLALRRLLGLPSGETPPSAPGNPAGAVR
jgi:hypothetical protein